MWKQSQSHLHCGTRHELDSRPFESLEYLGNATTFIYNEIKILRFLICSKAKF